MVSLPLPLVILIPSYGGGSDLQATLSSLGHCQLPESYSETWVIENGPESGIESMVISLTNQFPALNLKYLYVARANKSNALNEAIERLEHPCLLFFTDDDVRLDSHVLIHYANAAKGINSDVYFGGAIEILAAGEPDARLIPLMPGSMTGNTAGKTKPSRFFLGANWAAFSEDINRAGGFDPRFGPGSKLGATGNESTMMRALQKLGCKKMFLPDAVVQHSVDYAEITEEFIQQRGQRGGVERGIRWSLQYGENTSVIKRIELRAKLMLSQFLATIYARRSQKTSNDQQRIHLACRSAYHRGIVKGWTESVGERS